MRYPILLLSLLFFFACGNGAENASTSTDPNSQTPEASSPSAPPPAPALPANMSVPDLRNEVRNALRMQLPLTYPEQRNNQLVKKSYSFDIEPYEPTGKPVWVITEKLHDSVSDKLLTAGQYLMLWEVVDPNFGYVYAENNERIGLTVRAKKGQSFIFHPYAQELQDQVVTEVVIGWYDRVQDATLARAIVAMQTLGANMEKWRNE